jgi:hypothetical protein|tara:strand:- start:209 stop:484 length:276 start_codon:yes stop_codon:yes gene_type:complete
MARGLPFLVLSPSADGLKPLSKQAAAKDIPLSSFGTSNFFSTAYIFLATSNAAALFFSETLLQDSTAILGKSSFGAGVEVAKKANVKNTCN